MLFEVSGVLVINHNSIDKWSILIYFGEDEAHSICRRASLNATINIMIPKISNKFGEYFSDIGNQFVSKIPKPDKPFHHYLEHNTNYTNDLYVCYLQTWKRYPAS